MRATPSANRSPGSACFHARRQAETIRVARSGSSSNWGTYRSIAVISSARSIEHSFEDREGLREQAGVDRAEPDVDAWRWVGVGPRSPVVADRRTSSARPFANVGLVTAMRQMGHDMEAGMVGGDLV